MEDVIEETPRGLALRLTLNLRGGLHARPAARLAQEAQRYAADIQLIGETGEVDAKSMLDILSLAPPANAELILLAKGDDAREALHGLARFLTTLQEEHGPRGIIRHPGFPGHSHRLHPLHA